jgi:hypothetical protein
VCGQVSKRVGRGLVVPWPAQTTNANSKNSRYTGWEPMSTKQRWSRHICRAPDMLVLLSMSLPANTTRTLPMPLERSSRSLLA